MRKRRILKESAATVEVAISKCLSKTKLMPSELSEVEALSMTDLMIDHDLDSVMAEIVVTHALSEKLRCNAQSQQTWDVSSRPNVQVYTRTDLVPESFNRKAEQIIEIALSDLEDITDLEDPPMQMKHDGRMLDYGHQKSDSGEGWMMKKHLFKMGKYANALHDMINDDDDLPQWCHYKIAVASNSLSKIKHYLEYKIQNPKQK